ncbi:MAG TPA: thioredoxin domain-containing protein [Solirubrobacteraceae bacterium]|nr:thioredoxin domain-containing protein [Solirubrobacteraceae bacterium]
MSNALAAETSPYLRQHSENPVDWLPWGPEAFALAHERNVPVLVSIGYSSCHWCHVMERESFEDERTAAVMNESFVCIKVDREERPDVDALYMEAVQGMTGHGGWPLNVFLTPEQLPFYGGTYFPPDARHGTPAWTQVLNAIAESWSENSAEIRAGGERLRERLTGGATLLQSEQQLGAAALDDAVEALREQYDSRDGGFGGAPKFPHASAIELLLLRSGASAPSAAGPADAASEERENGAREPAIATLRRMAAGGIHDQLGGGFARYSVDASWTVPHFEKMLYDNALLARAYLHGWQASGEEDLLAVCRDVLDWTLREMRGPEGGFYSALDADSDGGEGRFYVWSAAEIRETLADAGLADHVEAALSWLGVGAEGNFRDPHEPRAGVSVLTDRGPRPPAETRERIRAALLQARELRSRPALDDKRLTSWNALMIAALADAGAALAEPRYMDAAKACAEFLLGTMRDRSSASSGEPGRLLRSYNDGRAKIGAYLEDHAFLLEALVVLFETSCEERWYEEACSLADETIVRFADDVRGGFFSTAADGEALIARRKDLEDAPIPAGASSAAMGLLRLAQLSGDESYEQHAVSVLKLLYEIAPRYPTSFAHVLQVLHWYLEPARPIACAVPVRR